MDSKKGRGSGKKKDGGGRTGGRLRSFLQKDAREFIDDIRKRPAEKAEEGRVEAYDSRGLEPEREPDAASGARGEAAAAADGVGQAEGREEAAEGAPGERRSLRAGLAAALKSKAAGASSRLKRVLRDLYVTIKRRSPVGFTYREEMEELPPMGRAWYRLLLSVLAGLLIWVVVSALLQRRLWWVSMVVGVLVAVGVVLGLGARFGRPVGVMAAVLVLFSLVMGELAVVMLYRAGVIEDLDIARLPRGAVEAFPFYRSYYYNLIVNRLLPPAVIAFLVGWWPFRKRPSWRGFGGGRKDR